MHGHLMPLHTPLHVPLHTPLLHCPELYQQLLDNAKCATGAMLNGHKTIKTCQSYLLLSVYHLPLHTFHEDSTFLYLRLTIR